MLYNTGAGDTENYSIRFFNECDSYYAVKASKHRADDDEEDIDDDFNNDDEEETEDPFEIEPSDKDILDDDFPLDNPEDDLLDDEDDIPYN